MNCVVKLMSISRMATTRDPSGRRRRIFTSAGTIPGQVDLAADEGLNQGVIVRIQDPVEGHIHTVEMFFDAFENGYDVRRSATAPDFSIGFPPESSASDPDCGGHSA